MLDLAGKRVLVVGTGAIADEKLPELIFAEADIVQVESSQYADSDLQGVWLVVAATGDTELNAKIAKDATARNIWINAADDPANCSAILPARVRRGSLLVTISTNGLSPALSSWFRRKLENEIGEEYENLLNIVAEVRSEAKKTTPSLESLDWQTTLDLAISDGVLDLIGKGNLNEAKVVLKKCLLS